MAIRIDKVQLEIELNTNYEAQQLNKFKDDLSVANDKLKELENSRKSIEKAKPKKGDAAAWAEYEKRLESVNQEIKVQRDVVEKATRAVERQKQKMGLNALTLRDLQNELKAYNTVLNNLQPGTKQFNETKQHIMELKGRIKELRDTTTFEIKKTRDSLFDFAEDFNKIGFAVRNLLALKGRFEQWIGPMTEMAMAAEGVELAFGRLNKPDMLDQLREATHGTVSDLELMKQAVKFKDFNLPVEQLGTYLAFAQQKAKDTGEDIDYLVTSIVNGLGRQSKPILDNLGISALEIGEEVKKTGDFVQAVTNIVGRNMEQTGDYVETFSDRAAQAEVRLKNAQLDLGRAWLPVKESIDGTFTDLQIGVIDATKWLVEHRKIVYSLMAAMVAYSAAVKIYTAIQNGANISLDLFNKLSKKNIFGLIMAGIAAAIPWLISFINRTKEAASAQNELAAAEREGAKSAAAETAKVKSLYGATQDATRSMDERLAAVKKIKSEYPSYFGDLSNEAILAGQAAGAYRQLASDIIAAAKARAIGDKITEMERDNLDYQDQYDTADNFIRSNKKRYQEAKERRRKNVYAYKGSGEDRELIQKYEEQVDVRREAYGNLRGNNHNIKKLANKQAEYQSAADRLDGNTPTVTVEPTEPKKTNGGNGKDDAFQSDLAALEKNRREALNILKQSLVDGKVTETEFQAEQQAQQMAYLQAKIALEKQYGKDSSETEGQLLDAVISEANAKHQQLLAEERENEQARLQQRREMLQQMEQAEKDALTGGNYAEALFQAEMMYSLDLINFEEYQRKKAAIEEAALKASLDREMKSAVKSGDFEGQLSVLQQQLSAKLITQEQYEDEVTRITEEQEQRRHAIREAFTEQAQALMSAASSLFSALQSREESRVDAKYKKLIAQAKKQGKDTSKLEEQQEAEKLEIKKKYADKQFLMNVLNIMANTALGITKTIAEWGMPWAVPFVAMTAASGAVQLATAKAQRDQAAGLYSGGYSQEYVEGYTSQGDPTEVAGVIPVHKREFVVNHEALNVPAVRRVTDVIDSMQKRRVYSMTDATAELQRAVSPGLASGGYSSTRNEEGATRNEVGGGEAVGRLIPLMERNNALLDEMLESGITILELRRQIRRQEQLEKNASR